MFLGVYIVNRELLMAQTGNVTMRRENHTTVLPPSRRSSMKNRIGSKLLRITLAAILFTMISFTTGCSAYYQRTVVADKGGHLHARRERSGR